MVKLHSTVLTSCLKYTEHMSDKDITAIGLLSGGLDSTLAVLMLRQQGINIKGINFRTGFCLTGSTKDSGDGDSKIKNISNSDSLSMMTEMGVSIEIIDLSDNYLDVLHHPKFGYGKNVNPCIDCRIHMFKAAREIMEKSCAQFVFTGEVLGQRPKSQHLVQLRIIEKHSGLEDRLLRPLSAKLLKPTLPENEGWIDRSRLLALQGRTRKPQMKLARELGLTDYPTPAGGCCYLTDPSYGRKVQDLWCNKSRDDIGWNDYMLLKVGRHLRVNNDLKVIVGRNEHENLMLSKFKGRRPLLEVEAFPSPIALIDDESGKTTTEEIEIAAGITARYSDGKDCESSLLVRIEIENEIRFLEVKPFKPEETSRWVIE